VIQVEVTEWLCNRSQFWTQRNELLDMLRPNRAFSATGVYRPLIYRKRLPGGKVERGSDMATIAGSDVLICPWGRFVHYGGLVVGDTIELTSGADAGVYVITAVVNDYTLIVNTGGIGMTTTAPAPAIIAPPTPAVPPVGWRYVRNRAIRDLNVLLEQGPTFDERIGQYRHPDGYREALRFVAHDPVWRGGELQTQTWEIATALGDLVFDGLGAWFGATPGVGRWLFAPSFVGETASVVYWGTWAAKPIIEIAGPATNPTIVNSTIGVQLNLAYAVALGETVTIDTQNLTVTNNAGTNLLPYLSGDLATFELTPAPQGATLPGYPDGRVNNVFVSFSDGVAPDSAANLYWYNRYIGI
jgi:hypothetical protein